MSTITQHHCRNCGNIFCDKCTQGRIALTADQQAQPVRVCDRCMVCICFVKATFYNYVLRILY